MSNIKHYFLYACTSSTIVILLNAFFSLFNKVGIITSIGVEINIVTALQLISICFTICFLMFLTDKFTYPNVTTLIAVHIFDIIIVVFGLGAFVYKMFPLTTIIILSVLLIIIITYMLIYTYILSKLPIGSKMHPLYKIK